jgi:hypothetical protein
MFEFTFTHARLSNKGLLAFRWGCGVFGIVALILFCGIFLAKLPSALRFQSASPTSCVILESRLGFRSKRILVKFRYELAGRSYISDQYDFAKNYDQSRNIAVLNQLRKGTSAVCYVDPSNPSMAVLDRSLSGLIVLGTWTGLLALCCGMGFMISPVIVRKFGDSQQQVDSSRGR